MKPSSIRLAAVAGTLALVTGLAACSSSSGDGGAAGASPTTYTWWDPYPQHDAASGWAKRVEACGTQAGVTIKRTAYDTTVAGVVSSRPGVILGVAAAGKEKIATTGRVKVKVDATHASILIGDLLVTSDVAGTAMKSEAVEINGRKFHQPGTVIGKALQPLPSGRGEILVLLSLQ